MSIIETEIDKLYAVADDDEAAVLDQLRHKAGIVWTCHGPHADGKPAAWTMPVGELCEICGRKKAQS